MNKSYWRRAGNPMIGWKMLSQDIKRHMHPRKQNRPAPNIKYNEGQSQNSTEDVNPSSSNFLDKAPTYNYYNYNYGQTSYGYLGFWKTVLLILFMTFVTVLVYYVCFNPELLVEWGHRIISWFQSF